MNVIKMDRLKMSTLVVIFLGSVWSSFVHCRVHGQWDEGVDSDSESSDSDDVNWPVLCPEETFYDTNKEECTVCSQCPINQVILSPCQGLQDTQCGPFISFQFLEPSNQDEAERKDDDDDDSWIEGHGIEAKEDIDTWRNRLTGDENNSSSEVDAKVSDGQSLSLLLVIVLAVVLSILALVLTITCYVRHKSSSSPTKETLCEYQPAPVSV